MSLFRLQQGMLLTEKSLGTHSRGDESVTTQVELKKHLVTILDKLPEETLAEVARFLDYLQYRLEHYSLDTAIPSSQPTPYKPVALGGLWEGVMITDEDIAEVRREMWSGFGEREL
jgi:hypothetical protein